MKTSALKITAILLILAVGFSACEGENDDEFLAIAIENRTDSDIRVIVFPKGQYPRPSLYPMGVGSGYFQTEFTILSPQTSGGYDRKDIRMTDDLSMRPFRLALNTFDSIHVIALLNENSVVIRFTPESVTGYSENIFSESSTWNLLAPHPTGAGIIHGFVFPISKDKITN